MSHFIKTQIMVVLQPFLDHVESNDKRICKLEDLFDTADDRITNAIQQLDATNSTVKSAIENLRQTDRRVEATCEGLHKCAEHMDQLQRGLEFSNEYSERIHNQARGVAADVPELRRSCDEVEKQLQALQVQFQRLSDGVMATQRARLDSLTDDMVALQVEQERSKTANETLRGEVQEESRLLHDARQELQKGSNSIGAVQQTIKDILAREKELGGRLEGWKAQWNKLQPAVDGLKKDAVFLKQSAESHDASIHGLQRGQQTLMDSFDGLHGAHGKMTVELDAAHRALKQTNQAVAEAQDNIGHNTSFANGLHTRLDQSAAELGNTLLQLRGLEGKHQALCDVVDRTAEKQDQMLQDGRKAANETAHMQRDLEKTNDNVATATKQLEVLSRGLQSNKGELGHIADRVAQIEGSTQAMHGAFNGLQKGFVDSGLEMGPSVASKKSERLPRLTDGAARSGSPNFPGTGTPRGVQRVSTDKSAAGYDVTAPGVSGMASPSDFTPMSAQHSTMSLAR
jgi:chromosome segregation ATPase